MEKLVKARCLLLTKQPFYGAIAIGMEWIPYDMTYMESYGLQPTMGVRIYNGQVQCVYHPPFVEKLTIQEIATIIQHEIEHVLRLHIIRKEKRAIELWWIATDMTIHGHYNNPKIGIEDSSGKKVFPSKDRLIWVPPDTNPNQTAEWYYNSLLQKQHFLTGKVGETLDNHKIWQTSNTTGDEARQAIKSLVDTARNAGQIPRHLEEVINNLNKPIIRWADILKRYYGRYVGSRRKTYSRRSRRILKFGVKGNSNRGAANVLIIMDTSASIDSNIIKQFFTETEFMASNANVTLVQWDTKLHSVERYRRGDWKKIKAQGRGGTRMDKALEWALSMKPTLTIMLTDGHTDWPSAYPYPLIVATTDLKAPVGHTIKLQ